MSNFEDPKVLITSEKAPSSSYNLKLENSKKLINNICLNLSMSTENFKPEDGMVIILDYIQEKNKITRLLYSEISGYLFQLDEQARGIFYSNIESLLRYALEIVSSEYVERSDKYTYENVKDAQKLIMKIYDHSNLVGSQIENSQYVLKSNLVEINNDFDKQAKSKYDEFENQIKSIEKEYVAILGIFATVVFAFTGVFSFSSSIIENINQGSIYRLIFVILVLSLIFINLIFGLFSWINHIVNRNIDNNLFKHHDEKKERRKESNAKIWIFLNIMLCVSIFLLILSWRFGLVENRNDKINLQISTIDQWEETTGIK